MNPGESLLKISTRKVISATARLCRVIRIKTGVYCEKNSVLTVVRADRREDSGIYKIRLTCMGGSNEATGRVNVLDVPTKPRNFQADEASCRNIL